MTIGPATTLLRRVVHVPEAEIPPGRTVELPGRGSTYVTDIPGPEGAPTVVLLHAVACTGLLTWFPALAALSQRYRVVTFDQRWHGRGIQSDRFSLYDCADDVAALVEELDLGKVIVAGYSMGSIVAQRVWRQHPEVVAGLVLCASTDRFRRSMTEHMFHEAMQLSMAPLCGLAHARTARAAARATAKALEADVADLGRWALGEFRSTSPWAVAQAVAAIGRHHSTPWLRRVDVPTAVVVTRKDKVISPQRQRALAMRIPATTVHEVDTGHAGCVLQDEKFLPGLMEAVAATAARARDRAAA